MYPKRQQKSDRERFLSAFGKQVGTTPEIYLRRKLSAGMQPGELKRLYDLLAVEIAKKAHCTPIRFDEVVGGKTPVRTAELHRQRAAESRVPVCPRCGAQGSCFPSRFSFAAFFLKIIAAGVLYLIFWLMMKKRLNLA